MRHYLLYWRSANIFSIGWSCRSGQYRGFRVLVVIVTTFAVNSAGAEIGSSMNTIKTRVYANFMQTARCSARLQSMKYMKFYFHFITEQTWNIYLGKMMQCRCKKQLVEKADNPMQLFYTTLGFFKEPLCIGLQTYVSRKQWFWPRRTIHFIIVCYIRFILYFYMNFCTTIK